MIKISYASDTEKNKTISEQTEKGMTLVEDAIYEDGKYLYFRVVNVEPSLDDYLLDLDFRLSTIELGL
jgi:hypothetical protein